MEYSGEMGGRKGGWGRREDWKIRSGNERQIWKWSNFHRSNSYPPALEVPGIEKHFTITSRENLRHGSRSAITQLAEYYFLHLRSSVTLGKSTSLSLIQHFQRGYSKTRTFSNFRSLWLAALLVLAIEIKSASITWLLMLKNDEFRQFLFFFLFFFSPTFHSVKHLLKRFSCSWQKFFTSISAEYFAGNLSTFRVCTSIGEKRVDALLKTITTVVIWSKLRDTRIRENLEKLESRKVLEHTTKLESTDTVPKKLFKPIRRKPTFPEIRLKISDFQTFH